MESELHRGLEKRQRSGYNPYREFTLQARWLKKRNSVRAENLFTLPSSRQYRLSCVTRTEPARLYARFDCDLSALNVPGSQLPRVSGLGGVIGTRY